MKNKNYEVTKQKRIVQRIPPNKPYSRIVVYDDGTIEIRSSTGKIFHSKTLPKAIRKACIHIPRQYASVQIKLLSGSDYIQHVGKIDKIQKLQQEIEQKTNDIIGKLKTAKLKDLDNIITEYDQAIGVLQRELSNMIETKSNILSSVQKWGEYLLKEAGRCDSIIIDHFERLLFVYKLVLEDRMTMVDRESFFHSVRAMRTVKVNPYRERTLSKEVKDLLKSNLKSLKAGELEERLWEAILKVVPVYPKNIEITINGNVLETKGGIVRWKELKK